MIWLWFLAFAAIAGCRADDHDEDFYHKVFETVDPDMIFDNERILQTYLKCFYDEGPCNAHAKLAKEAVPDVFGTVCGKCSDKQKGVFKYSLNKFIPAHPADWERILSIYDPKGEAKPKLEAFRNS